MNHTEMKQGGITINQKYLLTVREAAEYFGIGIKAMRRMAENNEGGFALYRGNKYLICRPAMEEYFRGIMENTSSFDADLE